MSQRSVRGIRHHSNEAAGADGVLPKNNVCPRWLDSPLNSDKESA